MNKKKKSITYYIKSIFSRWTHNRKKNDFRMWVSSCSVSQSNWISLSTSFPPFAYAFLNKELAIRFFSFLAALPGFLSPHERMSMTKDPKMLIEYGRKKEREELTFRHCPHLIFTKFSESRMMLDTTLTLFSRESIIDRLSAAETAIELLFKGTWFVRLEVSRCKGNGIWIECPCCSFWWSFWKVFYFFLYREAALRVCEGGRERGRKKKKRKLENLKIKRNSICRRLRIAKKREKNRVLSSNSFNINVPNVTSFFHMKTEAKGSIDIE